MKINVLFQLHSNPVLNSLCFLFYFRPSPIYCQLPNIQNLTFNKYTTNQLSQITQFTFMQISFYLPPPFGVRAVYGITFVQMKMLLCSWDNLWVSCELSQATSEILMRPEENSCFYLSWDSFNLVSVWQLATVFLEE